LGRDILEKREALGEQGPFLGCAKRAAKGRQTRFSRSFSSTLVGWDSNRSANAHY